MLSALSCFALSERRRAVLTLRAQLLMPEAMHKSSGKWRRRRRLFGVPSPWDTQVLLVPAFALGECSLCGRSRSEHAPTCSRRSWPQHLQFPQRFGSRQAFNSPSKLQSSSSLKIFLTACSVYHLPTHVLNRCRRLQHHDCSSLGAAVAGEVLACPGSCSWRDRCVRIVRRHCCAGISNCWLSQLQCWKLG